MNKDMQKGYEPKSVENKWYDVWLEKNYFNPDISDSKETFSIVIPPPNVTGQLHMGHALNNTLQDVLTRWKRMKGFKTLWVPGTDHAGIATQNVVEKSLLKENLTKEDLGREKFLERVWVWKEKYGNRIIEQLKKLGCSCDWSRTRFTMDSGLSEAVKEVFVSLYNEGLIYKSNYIINWCPRCKTALSDIEVEYNELDGHFYHIKYYFENSDDYVVIATTRPETMLGDTAVAVHPDDERYKNIKSNYLILPLLNRRIPLIRDNYVDPEFGTGALKITPAHDPNDFLIGKKHNLETVNIFNEDATTNENAGKYSNKDRYEVRKMVIQDLKDSGHLVEIENYRHNVGHCYRCETSIEPYISKQWFVKMKPLAKPAIEAVKNNKTKFHPVNWEKTYFEWMENIRDWCISRQIWWGHQIPAWYCQNDDCNEIIVSTETPDKCPKCNNNNLVQDNDVLDTWFSSALWPFSTLGWKNKTEDLKNFYPTSVLSTAFDIIYFWVARMMIMGIHFMKDIPFNDVYIHALIRTETGAKMSKSSGNVIDPLDIIDKYGCDALRFTLTALAAQGRDIRISENIIEGYRHFMNKIWNSFRYITMNLTDDILNNISNFKLFSKVNNHDNSTKNFNGNTNDNYNANLKPDYKQNQYQNEDLNNIGVTNKNVQANFKLETNLNLAEKWILYNYNELIKNVNASLDSYKFNDASYAIYKFLWHQYCDWYIEITKIDIYGNDKNRITQSYYILFYIFKGVLKLLHPFTPFITEELYQNLPHSFKDAESIVISKYPEIDFDISEKETLEMNAVIDIITGIRNIRQEFNIPPTVKVKYSVYCQNSNSKQVFNNNLTMINSLAKCELNEIIDEDKPYKQSGVYIGTDYTIYVFLKGSIDIDSEILRLEKQLNNFKKELLGLEKRLNNNDFIAKAKKEVIDKTKTRFEELKEIIDKLKIRIERLKD